ncbi:uncharacterized protein UV8b_02844 [Ustilaginoidea virens]|uniref:Uncharacterized protein n=1 Tax=Ustilaginoidea virens TaxID=1159556 RepID=A0A8E5MFN6_USTVR|nr:uncharacterized protein UV8b_02844 [Ustilaginoidea virens]QUC18603.1 hypothetical protein UV8b_02844 [Ustilaginoidea virens]
MPGNSCVMSFSALPAPMGSSTPFFVLCAESRVDEAERTMFFLFTPPIEQKQKQKKKKKKMETETKTKTEKKRTTWYKGNASHSLVVHWP